MVYCLMDRGGVGMRVDCDIASEVAVSHEVGRRRRRSADNQHRRRATTRASSARTFSPNLIALIRSTLGIDLDEEEID